MKYKELDQRLKRIKEGQEDVTLKDALLIRIIDLLEHQTIPPKWICAICRVDHDTQEAAAECCSGQ